MTMSEQSREQISALMDDELDNGSHLILNALRENHEFRQAWDHYHLIGETLRGNLPEHVDVNLAERISQLIMKEPAIISMEKPFRAAIKPVIGFAIAASVAAVAILGVRQIGTNPVTSRIGTEIIASNSPDSVNLPVTTVSSSPVFENETHEFKTPVDAESRLNRYLVNYNEYRTNRGVQGMLPYVRIVAHEVEE
jgi:sigma-E factor negative regulatory protein RseA